MAASVKSRRTDDDLITGTPFDLGAAQTGKSKSRAPEVLVGIFLVALFALVGAWFYSTSTASIDVTGLRNNVQRGAVITEADLIRHEVGIEGDVGVVLWSQRGSIIGSVATADLAQGMLVHPSQFGVDDGLPEGQSIIGLSLDSSQYPVLTLVPNDIVRIIYVPDSQTQRSQDQTPVGEVEVPVLVPEARVITIADGDISLQMPTSRADIVSAAGADGRVHIIKVRGS